MSNVNSMEQQPLEYSAIYVIFQIGNWELPCDIPDFVTISDAPGECGELCSPISTALPRWDSHFPFVFPDKAWELSERPMPRVELSKTI